MHGLYKVVCFGILSGFASCTPSKQQSPGEGDVSVWITSGDKSSLLSELPAKLELTTGTPSLPVIDLDAVQRFQTMDGFGYALTGGSAYLIHQRLSDPQQAALLKELFLNGDQGIGVSYLRISIGGSDLDDHPFTYDDMPAGKSDAELSHFTMKTSERDLIPVLKKIIAISPDIKIMGSPWSAPAWMKTNRSLKGGSLKPEYYSAYARYFVRYIKEMKSRGIRIDAVTLQNEPENPKNNPSMVMTAIEQAVFVKDHLGPAFKADSIDTKIIVYDHNCDHPDYPVAVLNDDAAKRYIDGSAFHLYLGEVDALSTVHLAHPDRNIYFTEQWTSAKGQFNGDLMWHTKNLIIGASRNWSKNVIEWNLAADPFSNPHTNSGGCTECLGALTIGSHVTRNVSYYIIAHASKFVPPGSVRIASNGELPNVAFVTPEGKRVLIVLNEGDAPAEFALRAGGKHADASLPPKSVGSFIW